MFFYARPPVFGGEPAEVEKHIDNLKVVDARCVAEVVMHPAQFLKFASIIQDQAINIVENYKAVREKLASSSGESTEIKP